MTGPAASVEPRGPMRILLLSRYGRLGASTRMRSLQFVPYLSANGCEVVHAPLLDDEYLHGRYRGRVHYGRVLRAYIGRARTVLSAPRYDLVWAEKELLPWLPAVIELGLLPKRVPVVVDYDDAIFHRYDEHQSPLVRRILGRKIDAIMRRATVVVAGNDYLAGRARGAGCRRVEVVPTVVDLTRYSVKPASSDGPATVGWIGSPATAGYLQMVAPALRSLGTSSAIRYKAIGARPDQVAGTPFEAVAWSEDGETEQLRSLDIGIMPLPDEPWERGKCGYKLVQYMATGLPVVASPVGVNRELVDSGVNGFLAESEAGWATAVETLAGDSELRRRMGMAGRARVEAGYSVQVQAPRLLRLFKELSRRSGHAPQPYPAAG